ncbi:MAG: DegT/DnrJ/EryC1/StrS family aminotransferase [Candidatus Aminicenantes bacterium]|nr:DegT/DnrJ/EryC1/StrS family aminotransferase [Candidatus Aminicenantes bacterium]
MQFIDLAAQQKKIRAKIEANINKVLDHGRYIMGPEIKELEEKLAAYVGVDYAVGVASGTDALLMSLMAYEIGEGDAVLTTPFTFIATGEVIRLLGATPVFVDIDPDTYNIDPVEIENALEKIRSENELTPRCIIPVDLFGQAADYDEINAIAEKHGLYVIGDAAQSFGASYKGKKAGSLTEITATSFFPAKPLGAYGDGGMVFTRSAKLYEKLSSIRVHGQGSDKYNNIRVGINGRLDSLQAAVLLAKLEIFDEEVELRQEKANRYSAALKDHLKVPFVRDYNVSAWAQYSLLHPQRDAVIAKLKEKGIPTAIYYPKPLHLQDAFSDLHGKEGDFPVSERTAAEIFSIPMHPYLTAEDQERIVQAITDGVRTL